MSILSAAPSILVVEDEFASLEVLTIMLGAKGYQVLSASNGEEALRQARATPVDLVLTDYMMPSMDGVTLCDELALDERLRHIPVIMMTASHLDDVPARDQVVALFGKPLLFEALLETVRRVLARTR